MSEIYNLNSNTLLSGTSGNDYLQNMEGNNVTINAGEGNDSVYNDASNVSIFGGNGNDSIKTGAPEDSSNLNAYIDGGEGNDRIYNYGSDYAVIVGNLGDDYIDNWGENVLFKYKEGDGNDIIQGFNETSTL